MEDKIKAYGICLYKIDSTNIKILLCKSVKSKNRWGFVKGVQHKEESKKETAVREFLEESSILIEYKYLEEYFEQKNDMKDIGIFLVNYDNIKDIKKYFEDDILKDNFLCSENSEIKFFNLKNIEYMKKKQLNILEDIIKYFKKGN